MQNQKTPARRRRSGPRRWSWRHVSSTGASSAGRPARLHRLRALRPRRLRRQAAPSAAAAKTAKSAADMGGVDAVCAAGKAEGQVNLIATPPDWANYGQMITDFTAKYGIKVQSDQPDVDSQAEINAATHLAGTGRQPDIFDLTSGVATDPHRHARPVQGRDVGRHPRREQGGHRPLDEQLHRLPDHRLRREASEISRRSPTWPIPSTRARSPSTATR